MSLVDTVLNDCIIVWTSVAILIVGAGIGCATGIGAGVHHPLEWQKQYGSISGSQKAYGGNGSSTADKGFAKDGRILHTHEYGLVPPVIFLNHIYLAF